MKNRLQNKKLKSLATRCLVETDALSDARDLLNYYDVDLQAFMHSFLINKMGFSEPPPVHQDKKPTRKTGERPEKMGDKRKNPPSKEAEPESVQPIEESRPKETWEKKLYKKIMMQVHPDRLDSVSKNDRDRYRRIDFGDRMQKAPSALVILSVGIQLDIAVELSYDEQKKLMAIGLAGTARETKGLHSRIGWAWGESIEDLDTRKLLVKRLLELNGLQPPDDEVILESLNNHK